MEVDDLSPDDPGVFDVVLFLGVLYHLRDPMRALERVASVTGELLVLETLVDLTLTRRPVAAFYPGDSMDGDATNWWGPNIAAVKGMLREVGFPRVDVIAPRSHAWRAAHLGRNVANIAHSRVARGRNPLGWNYLTTDRLIVHARRSPFRSR
jgi:tRNA (mo5U34)-methyltransferase